MINLYFWIALLILLCLVIILFVRILTYPLSYFADMDLTQIHAKELQIPVGDIDLHACLYLPTYALNKKNEAIERLPLIFSSRVGAGNRQPTPKAMGNFLGIGRAVCRVGL